MKKICIVLFLSKTEKHENTRNHNRNVKNSYEKKKKKIKIN